MLAYLFTGGIDTGGFCFALVCRFAQLGAGGLYAINPRSSANIKRSSAGRLPQPIASNPRYAAIIGARCNVAALYSPTGHVSPSYNPEIVDAYEVGLKSDLFDRRIDRKSTRLNSSH